MGGSLHLDFWFGFFAGFVRVGLCTFANQVIYKDTCCACYININKETLKDPLKQRIKQNLNNTTQPEV